MNTPNKLTVLRMILIPIMLIMMLPLGEGDWSAFTQGWGLVIALGVFGIASFTDYLDGHLARKHNLVTNFGKLMDPLADKLLVLSAFVAFVQLGRLHAVVPIIIMAREFMVTSLRVLAAGHGADIAAIQSGKLKTVTQMIAIILLFLELSLRGLTNADGLISIVTLVANVFVVLAVLMTLYSGWEYLRNGKDWLKDR